MATLLFTLPIEAQRITGQIRGKITDPSLAVLSGVTVELTSDSIIGTRTTKTTSRGHYRFITLPPGFYNLTFRHPGFETEELRHVHVAVGTTTHRHVTLPLASMAETIDVTTEMPQVGLSPNDARSRSLNAAERARSQQETPNSITAFDATELENRTMHDLSDLADFTPNLEFATTSSFGGLSNNATVHLRGMGQVDTDLWLDPGVGIYLDGVYLARSQGSVLEMVDVEVVEVLRGPQGTLFGKNTLGGAISIVTRKPGRELAGHLELTAGNLDRLDVSARVSGGLSASLFGSLTVASSNADGFTRSPATGEDFSDDDVDSARTAWRFRASESVTIDWTLDASRQRERGTGTVLTDLPPATDSDLLFYNTALTLAGRQPFDERWITGDLRRSYSTFPSWAHGDVLGASLDVHALPGTNLSLRSITSYRRLDLSESKDMDGSPLDLARVFSEAGQRQWSEEVWLSGLGASGHLSWILGGFYFEERSREARLGTFLGDLFEALEALPGPVLSGQGSLCDPSLQAVVPECFGGAGNPLNRSFPITAALTREPSARSYAVFSEATSDRAERLSWTTGLRYSREEKKFVQYDTPGEIDESRLLADESWDSTTARFNLAFQATPSLMLYLTAATGFKSGGFFSVRDRIEPFDPEKVWSFEAGLKTSLFSNRLSVQASLFWNDYTDLQLSTIRSHDGIPVEAVENAGKALVRGFDLALQAWLSDSLHIDVGVGHIDAKYTELEDSAVIPALDAALPRTPRWNLVFSPEYVVQLREGGAVVLHADYTYKTRLFYDFENEVAQEAYGLLGARMSFIFPSGVWEAYAYGTNLAGLEYEEHGFEDASGFSLAVAGRPREWGTGLKYRF